MEAQVKSLTEDTTQTEHINTIIYSNGKRVIPMMKDTLPAHFEVANLKGHYNTSELVKYMDNLKVLQRQRRTQYHTNRHKRFHTSKRKKDDNEYHKIKRNEIDQHSIHAHSTTKK